MILAVKKVKKQRKNKKIFSLNALQTLVAYSIIVDGLEFCQKKVKIILNVLSEKSPCASHQKKKRKTLGVCCVTEIGNN